MKSVFGNFSFKKYILTFLITFLLTVILAGIIGVVFAFFNPPDWLYNIVTGYLCYFPPAVASFLFTVNTEKNGLLSGVICADIYMIITVVAGTVILKNVVNAGDLFKIFAITTVAGGLSGVIGINIKK